MRRRKWMFWALGLVMVAAFLLAAVWPMLPAVQRAEQARMRTAAAAQLRRCKTLDDAQTLVNADRGERTAVRTFEAGKWLAIRWHCAHDYESGWDGAVLKDSDGHMFWTEHHFCGYEGFQAEFVVAEAGSPEDYYRNAGIKLVPIQ